jgi:hypothetical protein
MLRFRPSARVMHVALLTALSSLSCLLWCQEAPPDSGQTAALAQSVNDLQQQVKELRAAVTELRAEAAQYHAQTDELQRQLQAYKAQAAPEQQMEASNRQTTGSTIGYLPGTTGAGTLEEEQTATKHPASLEEQLQLLTAKVDDQYQTKVESASKYRLRLSGILLFNLFSNRGYMDSTDIPHLVQERNPDQARGSFGGTLRQSLIGLEVFGPTFAGAKTRGEVQFDFAGGFPPEIGGITSALIRLRTATLHLDWNRTSIIGGQDTLFFSPLSPTSLASVAVPALTYSGNLYSWTPQLRIEHRIDVSDHSSFLVQAGILDPLTGEPPVQQFYRTPQAGEAGNAPAVASRVAWSTTVLGQPLTVGAGGYYSRENWGFGRVVDGWAGMTDWSIPFGSKLAITGEFYRGRGIGGLGGAIGRSVLFTSTLADPNSVLRGLDDIGGWSQLKVKPWEKLEFNAAFGQDNAFANDVKAFSGSTSYFDPKVARNRSEFVNFIYHARSNLLFSMEYRRLRTFTISDSHNTGNHVNLGMGILF